MNTTRLLLPFTGDIHPLALEYAAQMAGHRHATLVALSLLPVKRAHGVEKMPRLEQVQQSQDFLAAIEAKAERYGVQVEQYERCSANDEIVGAIEQAARTLHCEVILLFTRDNEGILLSTRETKQLLEEMRCKVHVVRLASKQAPPTRWGSLVRRFRSTPASPVSAPPQEAPVEVEPAATPLGA